MEGIDDKNEVQESLFENSKKTSLFFITTQRNLMSFLGAGMLLPSDCQFRYKEDSREYFGGAIPFWKSGLPSSDRYAEMIQDKRLVVVECHTDDVMKYGGRFVVSENEQLIVINAPVPLLCVTAFYMHSKVAVDDFVMRVPDDVVVDSSIFRIEGPRATLNDSPKNEVVNVASMEPQLTSIDSFGGGIKALLHFMSDEISDYSYIRDLLAVCLDAYGVGHLDTGISIPARVVSSLSDSDKTIFLTLLPILRRIKPEDGYDQVHILEQLVAALLSHDTSIGEDIEKWIAYVKKAIEAEIEVPVLADKKDIFKRAVLLFLLRPDLDRLENVKNSSISPGPSVLSIAALLAGFAAGLTRMGPEYKGNYRDFNRFTKSLLDAFWCKSELSLNVVRESNAHYGASELYEINKEVLFKLEIRQNVVLARVLNQAKSAGYDLQYDYENQELYYNFDMGGDRYQTVYIELIKPLAPGFDVIRFVSPCMDLTTSKNKNKLKKDVAIDFLKRNCEDTMYCAFAYSERRQAIVAEAMQIVRTMDDDEFVTLLDYVAKVADEYERDVLGEDRY